MDGFVQVFSFFPSENAYRLYIQVSSSEHLNTFFVSKLIFMP